MKKNFPENILESFIITIVFFGVTGFCIVTFEVIFKSLVYKKILMHFGYVFGLFITLGFIKMINKQTIKLSPNANFIRFGHFAIVLVLSVFLLNIPIIKLYESYMSSEPIIAQNPLKSIIYLLAALTIAPIVEEIIFRGIILDGLLNNTKIYKWKAIIFSASLFAIIHISPVQVFSAFVIGFVCGAYYSKTRNLFATIILHSIANLFITIASYLHYNFGDSNIKTVNDLYGEYSLIILIACIVLIMVFFMRRHKT
ncbi:type II CAAX endopeptidase family protein [uncultured Algibacter sp.]|uniref:CPBP family intramembrane glutamic endopeptidase n=1 Tax=uncultured Algibacter sp. TaxID=298659 RepID=UPI00321621E2